MMLQHVVVIFSLSEMHSFGESHTIQNVFLTGVSPAHLTDSNELRVFALWVGIGCTGIIGYGNGGSREGERGSDDRVLGR